MPNNEYQRGNYFEARCAEILRGAHFIVWQTRGSKTAADLVALRRHDTLLVQCKSGMKPISHEGWNALYELAWQAGARPVVATRVGHGKIRWREVIAQHVKYSQDWPCREWTIS
jgi:Holliday junction resolvase